MNDNTNTKPSLETLHELEAIVSTAIRIRPHEVAALRDLSVNVSALAVLLFKPAEHTRVKLLANARVVAELLARIDKGDET